MSTKLFISASLGTDEFAKAEKEARCLFNSEAELERNGRIKGGVLYKCAVYSESDMDVMAFKLGVPVEFVPLEKPMPININLERLSAARAEMELVSQPLAFQALSLEEESKIDEPVDMDLDIVSVLQAAEEAFVAPAPALPLSPPPSLAPAPRELFNSTLAESDFSYGIQDFWDKYEGTCSKELGCTAPNRIMMAFDKNAQTRKKYALLTRDQVRQQLYNKGGSAYFQFYGTQPCQMTNDLEFAINKEDGSQKGRFKGMSFEARDAEFRRMAGEIIGIIKGRLQEQGYSATASFHFSENQEYKSSAHIHWSGSVWNGRKQQEAWLKQYCPDLMAEDGPFSEIFDRGVYGNGSMRLVNNTKFGDNRVLQEEPDLVLSDQEALQLYETDRMAFYDTYLIPFPKEIAEGSLVQDIGPPARVAQAPRAPTNKRVRDDVQGIQQQSKRHKPAVSDGDYVGTAIRNVISQWDYNWQQKLTAFSPNNRFAFSSDSKFCHIAGREHASNHVWFELIRRGDCYFVIQRCHDPDCDGEHLLKVTDDSDIYNLSLLQMDGNFNLPEASFCYDSFDNLQADVKEAIVKSVDTLKGLCGIIVSLSQRHGMRRLVHDGRKDCEWYMWDYNKGLWKIPASGEIGTCINSVCTTLGDLLPKFKLEGMRLNSRDKYIRKILKTLIECEVDKKLQGEERKFAITKIIFSITSGSHKLSSFYQEMAERLDALSANPYFKYEPCLLEMKGIAAIMSKMPKKGPVYDCVRSTSTSKHMAEMMAGPLHDRDFFKTLDQIPYLLGFKDCVIDLRDFSFCNYTPQLLISKGLMYVTKQEFTKQISENGDSEMGKFVLSCMEDDKDKVEYLQEYLGYCCTGVTKEQTFMVMTGEGRNGKGVLIGVLKNVMSDYSTALSSAVCIRSDRPIAAGAPTPHLIPIVEKRIGIYDESCEGDNFNEKELKLVSGTGTIQVRRLYGEEETRTITCKVILSTNYMPAFSTADVPFLSRPVFVKFPLKFVAGYDKETAPEHHRPIDLDLETRLIGNRVGVLLWFLKGSKYYFEQAKKGDSILISRAPAGIKSFGEKTKGSMDSVQMFINEYYDVSKDEDGAYKPDKKAVVSTLSFYNFYKVSEVQGKKFTNNHSMTEYMEKTLKYTKLRMLNLDTEKKETCWLGISFKKDVETEEEKKERMKKEAEEKEAEKKYECDEE